MEKLPRRPSESEGEAAGQWPSCGRLRPSLDWALHSAVSSLARIDDFHCEKIGAGFFSEVFKVRHRQSGQIMVLKMNTLVSNQSNMLREIQLMNRLSHPNILKLLGVCVHEGQLHALTEYINGGNLEQLLGSPAPLPWSIRVKLALNIASGLRYLHSKGIFHRDLTSMNCLVRCEANSYTAVVCDFGLAEKIPTYSEHSEKEPLAVVGSPYWMAPEVLRGEFYNEKADVFSYGIILCETIARIPADPDYMPRTEDFGLDTDTFHTMVDIDCPVAFLQLAFDCCSMDPSSRFSFLENTQCLEGILQHQLNVEGAEATPCSGEENLPVPGTEATLSGVARTSEQSPLQELGTQHLQPDRRLSNSQADTSFPKSHAQLQTSEPYNRLRTRETSPRVNPFSHRKDLKGGKIKLFDTPSKSVISLTFDLPPPTLPQVSHPMTGKYPLEAQHDFMSPGAPPRKWCSLPTFPSLFCQESLALGMQFPRSTDDSELPSFTPSSIWKRAGSVEEQLDCSFYNTKLLQPVSHTPPPSPNKSFICAASSGVLPWQLEPEYPSGLLCDSSHEEFSKLMALSMGEEHGLSELSIPCTAPLEQTEHTTLLPGHSSGATLEQEKELSCPDCCLSPFGLTSLCHQPAPSPPQYQNLRCEAESPICDYQGHSQHAPQPVLAEPSLKLPEEQS